MRENDSSSSSSSSFEEFYNLSWRLYSAFHMRTPSEADAAVEMWEIRSQMRIAAREERFVAARTIKHGSHPAKFGSIQMLLARRAITNEETAADQQHRSRIHDQIPLCPTDRSSELNAFLLLLVSRLTLGEWKSKQGRPANCDPSCDCKMKWERVSEAPLAI